MVGDRLVLGQRNADSLQRARRTAYLFQSFGGASFLLLVTLLATFALSQRSALKSVLSSTGSLLGLVTGAVIAVPIAVLLMPTQELPPRLPLGP